MFVYDITLRTLILIYMILGIMYSCGALGPAVGFLLGAAFLELYVHPMSYIPGTQDSDPGWVGCWWAGLILAACLSFIVSTCMGLFPRKLPNVKERPDVVATTNDEPIFAGFGKSLKGNCFNNIINNL